MIEQVVTIEDDAQVINVEDIKEEVVNEKEEEDVHVITTKDIREEVVNDEDDVEVIEVKDIKEEDEEIFDMVTPRESVNK